MNWLEKVRSQPVEKKLRLLWTIVAIAAIILIIFWAVIGNYGVKAKPDTSLFHTVSKGISDLSHQNFKTTTNQPTN